MKAHAIIIIATLTFSALYGCKSEIVKPQGPAIPGRPGSPAQSAAVSSDIVGKWSIVKDSTSSQFLFSPVRTNVYMGGMNDYYDFRTNGKCYISNNGSYDTISYKVVTANSVVFGDPVAEIDGSTGKTFYQEPAPTTIDPLTAHSAKIVSFLGTPAGPFYEAVYLSK
jgi:hypothetical protein